MASRCRGAIARESFLCHADPRTKLVLAVLASLAVMLPLTQLAIFLGAYLLLVGAAGLFRHITAQWWRLRVFLAVLFVLDWLVIGANFAVLITLRLALLATAFTLLFATTAPEEIRMALERIGLSSRFAFVFATTYRSLELVETEWQGILEAQRARGIVLQPLAGWGWRQWSVQLRKSVALIVPAVVMVAQRAWHIAEAAAVRGFDSPRRTPFRSLRLARLDHVLLVLGGGVFIGLWLSR